jgi:hypothetical protein
MSETLGHRPGRWRAGANQRWLSPRLPFEQPCLVMIRPSRPTVASAPRYPELISSITRTLTNSVLELPRLDTAKKRG